MRRRRESGQAIVELVGMLPVLAGIVIAATQLLAAGVAHELAAHAAQAGALALAEHADPVAAARNAVPGWSRGRLSVNVHGHRVRVQMRPASVVPGVERLLVSVAYADAGPVRPLAAVPTVRAPSLPDVVRSRDIPGERRP